MTVFKARGQLLEPTDTVNLTASFYDFNGFPVNTATFPTISIIDPTGLVILPPTTTGMTQLNVGQYLYQYTIPYAPAFGVYNDIWQGNIGDGYIVTQTLSFIVETTDLPAVNTDGYRHLGDDFGFNYSQCAINNINKLLKMLKARLNSSGKSKSTDNYGNVIYVTCDIYSTDMLVTFLANALSDFNQIPYFTRFTFDDVQFVDQFADILVEGATIIALASQALIEKGREYQITDNGVNFNPPAVAELLETQYSTQLQNYWEKLKYIKNSLRPAPLGLGTLQVLSPYSNPMVMRLRHLRSRQIF